MVSDEELIKDCIVKVIKYVDLNKANKYEDVLLSWRTNTDKQHELNSENISERCLLFNIFG